MSSTRVANDQRELAGDLELEVFHALQLVQVAVDDGAEAHLVEVDLLLEDQVGPSRSKGPSKTGVHS